ncbi:Transport and Golgi organization protein 6 [Halocaridina rubra]|uniref:Transport and Golgi organization protein 6 n=1 Tax=Halocaridina rubra TaxID=373956 RepID=A0AAN9AAJ4_HALRR
MAVSCLFSWLERYSILGSSDKSTLENVGKLVKDMDGELHSPHGNDTEKRLGREILGTVTQLLSTLVDISELDVRIVCSCHILAILKEVLNVLEEKQDDTNHVSNYKPEKNSRDVPPSSPNLLSVQQVKTTEDSFRVIMYTVVLGSLSQEASQYVKLMLARNKFILGTNLVSVPSSYRHNLLAAVMRIVLDLMKHSYIGIPLRGVIFPEVLCGMLELCFAPGMVKEYPDDTAYFRENLSEVLSSLDAKQTLQHLLLIKGLAKGGHWLQNVCGSLLVRRYLMQPNGVAAVIGAGLMICDGQDIRRCEAVASLVAHAKFPNIDLYYSSIGPQISTLMLDETLTAEILRVVMLTVSELAQRSATLTAIHVTQKLLEPLISLTSRPYDSPPNGPNFTLSLTRVHKLFVEIGIPSASLIGLLSPVLDVLICVAAFPTSHLRSLAHQCLVRYLSQQPTDTVVDILLCMTRLNVLSLYRTLNEEVRFQLDGDGGIRVSFCEVPSHEDVLEKDEHFVKAIIAVIETLKNPHIVRSFYEKLVLHIDFSVLNKTKVSPSVLLTEDDVRTKQFKGVRRVHICCSLLSLLADSEQLTNDLFQNLSAAVPVVDTLLQTSGQVCEDDALNRTRLSFLLNVVMMVSCYVNEQIMRKKMCSADWQGLKLLLPSLENMENNISDEAVLLFVENLRNLLLTHGVVNSFPDTGRISSNNENETIQSSQDVHNKEAVNVENNPQLESQELHPKNKSTLEYSCQDPMDNVSQTIKSNPDLKTDKKTKLQRDIEVHTTTQSREKMQSIKTSSYQEAMEDLVSPILPTRGHGLLALGKLIEKRDPDTISHKEQLLTLFQHQLKDEDSYLYLMATQGLSALCDAYPEKVVELLTNEFSVGDRSTEDRSKLAEVLVRASRRLGPMLPQYSGHFINSLLTGVRDSEAIIRASSLSSLGEICKLLRFSLGPILFEIFGVLQTVIDTDKAVEVRRAAVLVVTLILQGLGRDSFSVLKDVIRDLYRVLRLVNARDPDDVVRLHTQVAIEEIDAITKEFLFPKLNLTKRIFVADVPPSNF